MKKILVLVCASLTVVMLSACGSKSGNKSGATKNNSTSKVISKVKKEIVFNLGAEPKTLDPQLNDGSAGGNVINNMYEGLVRQDKSGKLIPAGATSWKISKDNLTYTFSLRKDAKWSDGKSVTASDYKYAWLRGISPSLAADYAYQFYYIKGAKAYNYKKGKKADVGIKILDKYTLQVTLSQPTAYFLGLTATGPYMPVRADMVAKNPDTWSQNPKDNISNGPFIMTKHKLNSEIILKPNPCYWDKANVKIQTIDFKMLVDLSTALVAYDNNKLSITGLPVQDIIKRKIEDPTFHVLPMLGDYYYDFNINVKPLNKIDVRKALSLAIDREKIVKNITKASQLPATGFVPFGIKNSSGKDFRKINGDYGVSITAKIKEAQTLLAKAGYPNGKGFPELTISYNTGKGHKSIAEAIQAMWKKNLGIHVKLQNEEWAVFLSKRTHEDFQIAREGWIADYSDPMTFLDLFASYSANNDTGWKPGINGKNPDSKIFNKLITEAKGLKASPQRDEDMAKAEKILHDSYVTMPIYYYTGIELIKANVHNWTVNSFGVWYFGNSYIEAKK